VPARHANLLFDEIEIVQQPFGSRSDAPRLLNSQGLLVVIAEKLFIGGKAGKEKVTPFASGNPVALCERTSVTLEQFDAEQLAPEGWFIGGHNRTTPLEVKFPKNTAPMPAPTMVPHHARDMQEHPVNSIQRRLHNRFFAIAIPARRQAKPEKCGGCVLQNANSPCVF
jgi:hypothetical protein